MGLAERRHPVLLFFIFICSFIICDICHHICGLVPWTRLGQTVYVDMGLLTILKKVKQKEKELRILILGLDNAG